MHGVESKKFWTTSIAVEAFQLTAKNIQGVSEQIGGSTFIDLGSSSSFVYQSDEVHIGDWIVKYPDGRYSIFSNDEFKQFFHSHDSMMNSNEKYAAVYLRVKEAMVKQDTATYHGDGMSDEMDLVAIQTTKALLELI